MDKRLAHAIYWAFALALAFLLYSVTVPARAAGDMPPPVASSQPDMRPKPMPPGTELPATGVPIPPSGKTFCRMDSGYCVTRLEDYMSMREALAIADQMLPALIDRVKELEEDKKPRACGKVEIVPKPSAGSRT